MPVYDQQSQGRYGQRNGFGIFSNSISLILVDTKIRISARNHHMNMMPDDHQRILVVYSTHACRV
jgi:hypothetical protein